MKIGFYDSGLGGIKTLKDIINKGLKEEIYFLADEKNKPYGTKKAEEVKEISKENVRKLVDLGCKIIVVACNTATSVAIEDLRKEFSDVDIIGAEPAIKPAIDEHLNKNIIVLATTITVNGDKLNNLINKLHPDIKVDLLPADKLVALIEDEDFLNIQDKINEYLIEILKKYDLKQYSHIILGCTHFSIVKENIEKILNEKHLKIKVIDGNDGIGNNLFSKIKNRTGEANSLSVNIICTAKSNDFEKRTKEILGDIKYIIN